MARFTGKKKSITETLNKKIIFQSQSELKSLGHCEFAYHLKKDEVCINPYHYTKTEQPLSILVPKNISNTDNLSQYPLDGLSTVPNNIEYNNGLK